VEQRRESVSSSSSLSSTSNSISLIKLDELSSFGATKQARLPALIKLNPLADLNSRESLQQQQQQQPTNSNSMPDFSGSQLEKMDASSKSAGADELRQQSLPAGLAQAGAADKENVAAAAAASNANANTNANANANQDDSVEDFQVVEMEQMNTMDSQAIGPSLPQTAAPAKETGNSDNNSTNDKVPAGAADQLDRSIVASLLNRGDQGQAYASNLGDSLIEMVINLRNENQNLIKALELNNSYVKERLSEFKRCQEESKKREMEFQLEKAELEHNLRKVQRQNSVLSERLKSMEAKLKDMKLEVSESLMAAHSSKASSIRGEDNLYPNLGDTQDETFVNSALRQPEASTMQIDATSGELYNEGDHQSTTSNSSGQAADGGAGAGSKPMETDQQQQPSAAMEVANMTKEELSKRFDAKKAEFYAMDDPMKQCDQLEQQLNDIGKRDYEICLLQQQLNIYRQDFRLERMAKLEAKIQIEKLKNEIDRLCLERLGRPDCNEDNNDGEQDERQRYGPTPATAAADGLIGRLGHHLSRKALRSAAKAAKYASKQAHLEEKAAAALARAAAAKAAAASHFMPPPPPTSSASAATTPKAPHEVPAGEPVQPPPPPHHGHHSRRSHRHHARHHHHENHPGAPPPPPHHHHQSRRSIRGEIVSDLMSTANKAMLTGYNLASTTINSALDKLSQYEQQQAAAQAAAAQNQTGAPKPTAPPMSMQPSMD
jgi:hypothetical protein